MKRRTSRRSPHSRGAALITVTIVLFVLGTICASILMVVASEQRLTRRSVVASQAKLNTDTLLDYAASQIANNPAVAAVPQPKLALPAAGFFPADSKGATSDSLALAAFDMQEVIASPATELYVESGGKKTYDYYIDPTAPINKSDKLKGQYVFRDLCLIAAKGAALSPQSASADPIYNHGLLVLERRKVSLFKFLAFFDVAKFSITNPGSNIVLDGPIQANEGLYFSASSQTSYVYMDSSVRTPEDFVFSGKTSSGKFMVTDGTYKSDGVTPNRIDLLKPNTTVLRQTSDDSATSHSFRDFMLNDTNGYLGTAATGETKAMLDGLNYVNDSASTVSDTFKIATNRRIDPTNAALRNSTDDAYADARTAEFAKVAYQASLYVYVEQNGTATVFVNRSAESGTFAASDAWKSVESYKAATNKAAWKAANPDAILSDTQTAAFVTMPYTVRYQDYKADGVTPLPTATDLARGAIYDSQQRATVSMVDLNLGKLNTGIAAGSLTRADNTAWSTTGSKGWNGVLYVDVQSPTSRLQAPVVDKKTGAYIGTAIQPSLNITGGAQDFATGGAVSDTTGLTAVRIQNATTVPAAKIGDPGFTLATNTATYTVGSFNADGKTSTGTTSLQDDEPRSDGKPSTAIPAAIFSDKNVVLSSDFSDSAYDLDLYVPKPAAKQEAYTTQEAYTVKETESYYDSRGRLKTREVTVTKYRDVTAYRDATNPTTGTPQAPDGMSQYLYDNWPFTGPAPSSSTYKLAGSGNGYYQYQRSPDNRTSGTRVMELSAGFMVGDDPIGATDPTNASRTNKGMHTILSFLQPFDSTNDALVMRGAMLAIYPVRYFTKSAGSFNDYYVAPSRNYGFSSLFKAGKMPPAAPTISSYRRMRQVAISADDYKTLKSAYDSSSGLDSWLTVVNKY